MIVCLVGTRAQLIKMAPVMLALERDGTPYRLVLTGQHAVTMRELLAEFGVRAAPAALYEGPEITGMAQMGVWFVRVLWRGLASRRHVLGLERGAKNAVVVHGDTFSTLLGALIGRLTRNAVVHVESGLTSGRLLDPFPEELTRRLVFRLATLAFCPGAWAAGNLARFRAEALDTGENTLVDAVRAALARFDALDVDLPPRDYAVVSLHRFENVFNAARFAFIVGQLETMAARLPLVFVMHPATRRQAEKHGLIARLEGHAGIDCRPRMTYVRFLKLVAHARFVVTDGGSNQEEMSYLGVPALLMRAATERREGLEANVVLSGHDPAVIAAFLERTLAAPRPPLAEVSGPSPSAMIASELAARYG